MDWHILHCGRCVKILFYTLMIVTGVCWWVTWRFAWFFTAIWHAAEAAAISALIAAVCTALILAGKLIRRWWLAGHPVPLPAFPDLTAHKRRVRPQEVPTVAPEHVYVVTDAPEKSRKFTGMAG